MGEIDSLIAVMGLILTSINSLNIRIDNNAKELRDIVGANAREVNGRIGRCQRSHGSNVSIFSNALNQVAGEADAIACDQNMGRHICAPTSRRSA